jgi:hypothetical protein
MDQEIFQMRESLLAGMNDRDNKKGLDAEKKCLTNIG